MRRALQWDGLSRYNVITRWNLHGTWEQRMHLYGWMLRGIAILLILVSISHLALGLEADRNLGAQLTQIVIADTALSSQSFFGVSYALYAATLWLAAAEPTRYAPALRAAFWITLAAGPARFVAWWQFDAPPVPMVILLMVELMLPPLLLVWTRRNLNCENDIGRHEAR